MSKLPQKFYCYVINALTSKRMIFIFFTKTEHGFVTVWNPGTSVLRIKIQDIVINVINSLEK